MNKYIDWLTISSKNPDKIALTIKGLLIGVLPVLLILTKMLGLQIGEDATREVIDGIGLIITYGFGIISGMMTIYGLVRKIYRTLII